MPDREKSRLREIARVLTRNRIDRGVTPDKLVTILTELGSTYVKIGQILSMRPDILPPAYCKALESLRSEVAPMPVGQVRAVIEAALGAKAETLFASFDDVPLGAASIAQAHKATLLDGAPVVVKVQRQGIRDVMASDIALLKRAFALIKRVNPVGDVLDFDLLLTEMWNVTQEEMDFLKEAMHLTEFARLNEDVAFVACPRVYMDRTAREVLTMEYVEGFSVSEKDKLTENGYDLAEIGAKLADNYIKQVITDGFFHADPHPGNIRVRGGQIVWIDLGMMGRLSEADRELIRKAVTAVAARDIGTLTDVVLAMGEHKGRVNRARLFEDVDDLVSRYAGMPLGGMNLAVIMEQLLDVAKRNQIGMPASLTMLSRGVATIEGVMSDLCPSVNMLEITAAYAGKAAFRREDLGKTLQSTGIRLLEGARKTAELPSLAADALRLTLKGQLRRNSEVSISDETGALLTSLVTRLCRALVAAVLILAAALTADRLPAASIIALLCAAPLVFKAVYKGKKSP